MSYRDDSGPVVGFADRPTDPTGPENRRKPEHYIALLETLAQAIAYAGAATLYHRTPNMGHRPPDHFDHPVWRFELHDGRVYAERANVTRFDLPAWQTADGADVLAGLEHYRRLAADHSPRGRCCWSCGADQDTETARRPRDGDINVCIHCGAFGVWHGDAVRRPTADEKARMAQDGRVHLADRVRRIYQRRQP